MPNECSQISAYICADSGLTIKQIEGLQFEQNANQAILSDAAAETTAALIAAPRTFTHNTT